MQKRQIPHTDLAVFPLCLGTMTFGAPVAEAEAIMLTHWALDHGINFIDTANMYEGYARYVGSPGGVAEAILGKALAGRRTQVVVASKVGMKIGPADDDQGLSRAHILREVERSLKRLATDYIDLYYMHKPDAETPLAEAVHTFQELITLGKIRYWGLSNFSAAQISAVLQLCDAAGWRRPVAVQPAYSLLKRDIETDMLPLCQREALAVSPYQVLQGGLLTGKYQPNVAPPATSRLAEKPQWLMPLTGDMFNQLDELRRAANAKGRTLLQHALLALLEMPAIVSLIIGAKTPQQIATLLAAIGAN